MITPNDLERKVNLVSKLTVFASDDELSDKEVDAYENYKDKLTNIAEEYIPTVDLNVLRETMHSENWIIPLDKDEVLTDAEIVEEAVSALYESIDFVIIGLNELIKNVRATE